MVSSKHENKPEIRLTRRPEGSNRIRPVTIPWKAVGAGALALGIVAAVVRASHKTETLPKRVALIGDSYAVGLGPELANLFPDFKYAGVVGTNTSQWANGSAACGTCGDWLAAFKPDVVLVSLGVNDGATPNPANYHTIVRRLHGLGARVVWIEPPALVRTAARGVIASLGVPIIPGTTTPLASGSRLHPAAYGHWAEQIAQAVT